jgi:hypothetical protein
MVGIEDVYAVAPSRDLACCGGSNEPVAAERQDRAEIVGFWAAWSLVGRPFRWPSLPDAAPRPFYAPSAARKHGIPPW